MAGVLDSVRKLFSKSAAAPAPTPAPSVAWKDRYYELKATYDAARASDEFDAYWANADTFDADSANSREVRHKLISRSRYELSNNGFADGIAQTYATDLVGVGPVLRMQTQSQAFNQMVERSFWDWVKAIQFRRKLWCMAHAKHGDGEGLGVLRLNRRIAHPVQLDIVLYEAEQCQTPYPGLLERGQIDGIRFDEFGNPLFYEFLLEHPGAINRLGIGLESEQIPAEFVLHWFKMRRPGQHRGVPESASTLNVGAAARRMREATLAAAETAADLNVMLTTQPNATDPTIDPMAPFSSIPVQKRMMTAAPMGWEAHHFKGEHPGQTYEGFNRSLINEQARPKNMPFNKAACDSSSYNYASGRLDHQTYYAALDVDREDCNDTVLDPLFNVWFGMAVRRYGWLGGDPAQTGSVARLHVWDWPKHRVADVESEANANETQLKSGQTFHHILFADKGMDFDDEVQKAAAMYGVDEQEVRRRLFDTTLPPAEAPAVGGSGEAAKGAVTAVLDRLNGSASKLLVNGGTHAN